MANYKAAAVRPPLSWRVQLLRTWQSKHLYRSIAFPFFLFRPVPLQPLHEMPPVFLHVEQFLATGFIPPFFGGCAPSSCLCQGESGEQRWTALGQEMGR